MQFHLNGFRTGDPRRSSAVDGEAERQDSPPEEVDVLIVGCGPAGLTLAAQLAAFPGIKTAIVEQKSGPLELGQADGIACRTMEMFAAFGFADQVERESYWVNETVFWKPDDRQRDHIARSGRIQDVEEGLSEFPHVILNQARVHDFYLDHMRHAANPIEPYYGRRVIDLAVDTDAAVSHPVTVRLERSDASGHSAQESVRARYVVGCDGARSVVRQSIGLALHGDSAQQAWGVMDVLAVSSFPDIRLKAAIHSAGEGSVLIIPREGGYLVRLYIELDKLNENERVTERNITIDRLIAAAQRVFHPFTLDVKEVVWWSCYEIGQRLSDRFDDVPPEERATRLPRVFIAGDACHTHSPKAGQGMNVSMQDGFNLGWKLASVLLGRATPQLLHSYCAERHAVAQELIDFDRELAAMFSATPKDMDDPDSEGVDPAEFQRYFQQQGRFTAGTATRYRPSMICSGDARQELAPGFPVGMRLHSAPVIRLADAKPMHLGHSVDADGRWRLFLFADRHDTGAAGGGIAKLCDFLDCDPNSPLQRYTPSGEDIDARIDVRAIFQHGHRDLSLIDMPALLLPRKGRYGLIDYEKIFCPDLRDGQDIFTLRQIDRDAGCMVLVRPDQYVAHVLPLGAQGALCGLLGGVLIEANR